MKRSILLSAIVALMCTGFRPLPSTCSRTLYLGDPTQEVCVGRGVCRNTHFASENPGGIPVTFSTMASNPDILIMSFSLNDLKQNQNDQVAYFTNTSATYQFQHTYIIPTDMVQELGLQQGARITPNSPSVIEINGDIVTDYITYTHD